MKPWASISLTCSNAATRSEASPAHWRKPFLSWLNGIEAGWAIPLLLVGFVAVWLAFLIVAYSGGDLHADVLEAWTLGRTLEWGTSKHPPLMAWVARGWTTVLPLSNWSFQLLALTISAVGLWAVDLISRRFVRGDKRSIVLLMLMLLPAYQFHAQRFNANTVLLPTWPIATYCFLRSFETRQLWWAAAAGATAALALLGKYYSVFLIGSFVIAAILHPQRRKYFGSWTPWISAIVGLVFLVPHLYWLATTGAMPFTYALEERSGKTLAPALIEAISFVLGLGLVLVIPALTWALIAGDRLRKLPEDFRTMAPGLHLVFLITIGTIAFPVITSVALGTDMPPIWGLQGLFLIIIVVVCSTSYQIERFFVVNLAVLVIAVSMAALVVAAPIHAYYRNFHPLAEGRNFFRMSAIELTRQWHQQSDTILAAVGGSDGLALATAFYSPDHPRYESLLICPKTQELPPAEFRRGWAALCFDEDALCIDSMKRIAARATRLVRSEFTASSSLLGWRGATQRFRFFIVPPSAEPIQGSAPNDSMLDLFSRCSVPKQH